MYTITLCYITADTPRTERRNGETGWDTGYVANRLDIFPSALFACCAQIVRWPFCCTLTVAGLLRGPKTPSDLGENAGAARGESTRCSLPCLYRSPLSIDPSDVLFCTFVPFVVWVARGLLQALPGIIYIKSTRYIIIKRHEYSVPSFFFSHRVWWRYSGFSCFLLLYFRRLWCGALSCGALCVNLCLS